MFTIMVKDGFDWPPHADRSEPAPKAVPIMRANRPKKRRRLNREVVELSISSFQKFVLMVL
jgi:hypothetical protein